MFLVDYFLILVVTYRRSAITGADQVVTNTADAVIGQSSAISYQLPVVTGGQKVFSWRREEVCSLALESFLAVDVNFHPISGSDQSASSDYEKQH